MTRNRSHSYLSWTEAVGTQTHRSSIKIYLKVEAISKKELIFRVEVLLTTGFKSNHRKSLTLKRGQEAGLHYL